MALEVWGFYDDQYAETGMAVFAQFRETYHPGNRIIVSIPEKTLTDSVGTVTIPATTIDVTAGLTYWYTDLSSSRITINFPNYSRDITSRPIDNHKYKLSAWFLFDFTFWNEGTVYHFDLLTGDIHFLSVPPSETSVEITSGGSGMSTRETIVLPVFMRYDWTVTFNANGGTTPTATKDVMRGQAYGDLPTPTRTGYSFVGWYTAASGGKQVTSASIYALAGDQTLYAHWTPNTYTVTLDQQDGSGGSASVTATFDAAMPSATMPTRAGYTFGGYFDATDGGGTKYYNADGSSAATWTTAQSTTLYAYWIPITYSIAFSFGTSETRPPVVTAYDSWQWTSPPSVGKTGYTFAGWTATGHNTSTAYYAVVTGVAVQMDTTPFSVPVDANGWVSLKYLSTTNGAVVTFTARWTANTYTVSLNKQGGSGGSASVTATFDAAMPTATMPTRTGYTFGGYFTSTGGSGTQYYTANGESAANWTIAQNTTLYAYWIGDELIAMLDPQGGVISGNYYIRPTVGEPYGTLPTPTRTGYTFAGWYTAATGGSLVTSATICTTTTNHTLYAQWTAVAVYHTVWFNATGGTVSETSRSVLEGAALGTLPTPTRTGYNFAGWFTSQVGGSPVTASTIMGDEDMEICAVWSATSVTITFNANGGSVSETTRSVAFGSQIGRLPVPVRVGYNFNGWFTAETGGTEVTAATVCTASQTLFAHWTNGRIDWWSVTFG